MVADRRIPTVRFDSSRVTKAVEDDVYGCLKALPDIPPEHLAPVYVASMDAVRAGGALNVIYDALLLIGLTKRRAKEIATYIGIRSSALMAREQSIKSGITYAIWRYSGVPCLPKSPSASDLRLDAEHKASHGRRFKLAQGLRIGGVPAWPGQMLGCRCIARVLVPGISN